MSTIKGTFKNNVKKAFVVIYVVIMFNVMLFIIVILLLSCNFCKIYFTIKKERKLLAEGSFPSKGLDEYDRLIISSLHSLCKKCYL